MAFLLGLLLTLEVVVAVLMVAVVMLQPPKDQAGGMGSAFGGGFEETFGGRTGNVLSRATVVLGIILILNSLAIAFCTRGGLQASSLADREVPAPAPIEAPAAPVEAPAPAPEAPAAPVEAPAPAPAAEAPAAPAPAEVPAQ